MWLSCTPVVRNFYVAGVLAILALPSRTTSVRCPPTVEAARTDSGVRFSVQVPRGPYFLGELLPVQVVLVNRGSRAIYYAEPRTQTSCAGGWVAATGGQAPFYPLPRLASPSCPVSRLSSLGAGQSLTRRLNVPLTASAGVTLSAHGYLFRSPRWNDAPLFASGLPTLRLRVMPRAPRDRILRLSRVGRTISVSIDHGHVPSLLTMQQVDNPTVHGSTTVGTWQPLSGHILLAPEKGTIWTVLVGAPGYRIAGAVYGAGAPGEGGQRCASSSSTNSCL